MPDTTLDKIRKLLNMTTANGCTEDEQETALRMASSLAARAGIELDSVRPADAPKPKAKAKRMSDELKPHQALAAQAAAVLYGVECNVYNLGAHGIMFVGREELIELAEETMFWLFRQIEDLYKQSLPRGLSKRDRAEYRKTFKAACASRVRDRALDLVRKMRQDEATAKEATGQNALVVQGYFTQLKTEIDDFWDGLFKKHEEIARKRLEAMTPEQRKELEKAQEKAAKRARKGRRGRSIPVGSGTNAGLAAGDRVQLRKEVGAR